MENRTREENFCLLRNGKLENCSGIFGIGLENWKRYIWGGNFWISMMILLIWIFISFMIFDGGKFWKFPWGSGNFAVENLEVNFDSLIFKLAFWTCVFVGDSREILREELESKEHGDFSEN